MVAGFSDKNNKLDVCMYSQHEEKKEVRNGTKKQLENKH